MRKSSFVAAVFLLLLMHAVHAGSAVPPPVITFFGPSDNPVLINSQMSITLDVSNPGQQQYNFSVNFGDGSPVISQTSAAGNQGLAFVAAHTYTQYGTFNVTATVNDAINTP